MIKKYNSLFDVNTFHEFIYNYSNLTYFLGKPIAEAIIKRCEHDRKNKDKVKLPMSKNEMEYGGPINKFPL